MKFSNFFGTVDVFEKAMKLVNSVATQNPIQISALSGIFKVTLYNLFSVALRKSAHNLLLNYVDLYVKLPYQEFSRNFWDLYEGIISHAKIVSENCILHIYLLLATLNALGKR